MEYEYGFEKLEVWKDARIFVTEIYSITKTFPTDERFALCTQMQRAAVSIVSNIAEGVSRKSFKEQIRYVEISYGSLMEVYCQLCVSVDLNYITIEQKENIKLNINKIANKLNALNRSLKERLTTETKNH